MSSKASYFGGIDGGGTGCRMRIRSTDNQNLAEATGGPANFYQDPSTALANICALIRETSRRAGVDPIELHLGLGLAGLVTSVDPATITAERLGVACAIADVDAYIACLGAFGGGEGGIVIAGTGSIGFAVKNGQRHMVGGWGMLLGDKGSGAWLGLEAVRRTTLVLDGLAAETELTRHVKNAAGNTMFAISTWSATATPKDYGAIAPVVFDLAAQGDVTSLAMIKEGAAAIEMLIEALAHRGVDRICLLGGLSQLYPKYFATETAGRLVPAKGDALDGAILMAQNNERVHT